MKKEKEFIFGTRAVMEAIDSGRELEKVLFASKTESENLREIFSLVRQNEIPFQHVPVEKLNRITGKNHQNVIAYISPVSYYPLEELVQQVFESGREPLFLFLDQISDVRNFGAIARSAEVLGFNGIIIPEKGAARIGSDAVKTSSGALLNIPVARVKSSANSLKRLKDSGIRLIAITEKADSMIYESDFSGPLALILGNEESGISENLLYLADKRVKIPVTGKTESLNVSVAAGIAIYEVVKSRR